MDDYVRREADEFDEDEEEERAVLAARKGEE